MIAKLKLSGYGKLLKTMIKEYSLKQCVFFTGGLNADQMAHHYKTANVFICPSSIENSPNSLGEAQLVGTPSVASFVGGNPDFVTHEESGLLYRFEEYEMLAYYISRIFEDDNLAIKLSKGGRNIALNRHNRKMNTETLISIYNKVLDYDDS